VDLRDAQLSEADLSEATFRSTDLSRANLSYAKLMGANLQEAALTGTDLSDAILSSTVLGEIDLSRTKGLESVRHEGPSTIGIDTIYLSKGMIPEVFLRGAGVPESLHLSSESIGECAGADSILFVLHQLFEQRP
jgi:uncharacterized protein YjbI with pentapeptide repeats